MKKILFVAALALMAAPAFAQDDTRSGDLHIKIVNNTSTNMTELYVSHVGTNSWEDNVLPEVAEPGTTQPVDIKDNRAACTYDIKAVFEDGGTAVFRNEDLCKVTTFTIGE